jgi:hypothetical protein
MRYGDLISIPDWAASSARLRGLPASKNFRTFDPCGNDIPLPIAVIPLLSLMHTPFLLSLFVLIYSWLSGPGE